MVPLALPGPGLKEPCVLGRQPWKFFPCHFSLALVRGTVSVRVTARLTLPAQGPAWWRCVSILQLLGG